MRPTGWVHAGKKDLGKYLKSVYVKSFLLFFDTAFVPTYKPSGSDIRVQIPMRTSVCRKLFLSYVFLHSNAIYRVSQKSPTSTCFFHLDLCVYIPPTENGMHIGMVAELVCITFRFDTLPWQTSSGVGTFRPPCIFCSQLIKPVLSVLQKRDI